MANLLSLVLPQKPIVDENTDQSFFDRLVNQSRRHGGINAAAEGAEHPAVADLFADLVDRSLDEMLHGPVRPGSRRCERRNYPEPRGRAACARLQDETARRRTAGSDRRRRRSANCRCAQAPANPAGKLSSCRRGSSTLASSRLAKSMKQVGVVIDYQFRRTIFALFGARGIAAESKLTIPMP